MVKLHVFPYLVPRLPGRRFEPYSLLTAAYHMLKNGTPYQDPGPNYFDQHANSKQTLRLLTRLKNPGYAVQIQPIAA